MPKRRAAPDSPLTSGVNDFLEDGAARGLLSTTLRTYEADLHHLVRFCAELKLTDLTAFTPAHLAAYEQALRGFAVATRRRMLTQLGTFLRWMQGERRIRGEVWDVILLPPETPAVVEVLTQAQVRRLLRAPDRSTVAGCRDAAMLETLYATGLRVTELCRLRLDALRGPLVLVQGKGGEERLVPVGVPAQNALAQYLAESRPEIAKAPHPALFLTYRQGQVRAISPRWFERLLERYAKKAGLRHVHPHLLRHTFATHLLQGGADLKAIQLMLGHKHLNSSARYTHVKPQDLRRAARLHPRA